jgi:hypothetical protein
LRVFCSPPSKSAQERMTLTALSRSGRGADRQWAYLNPEARTIVVTQLSGKLKNSKNKNVSIVIRKLQGEILAKFRNFSETTTG